jgi:hypothetical protein
LVGVLETEAPIGSKKPHSGRKTMLKTSLSAAFVVALFCIFPPQGSAAPDSFFDIFLESASSPPLPSSATRIEVNNHLVEGGPYLPTAELDLGLGASQSSSWGPTTLTLTKSLSGDKVIGDIQPSIMAPDSFFDIFLESFNPGQSGSQPIVGTPVVMAPDSFFDIFLECAGPAPGTRQTYNLHGVPAAGITFSGVGITNFNPSAGTFDIVGQMNVPNGYTFTPGSTAMTVTVTGALVPEPSTLVLLLAGVLGLAACRLRSKR